MNKRMKDLAAIFSAALKRVDPYSMIKERLALDHDTLKINTEAGQESFNLADFDSVVILGAGKATAKMALAVEGILRQRISKGVISVKPGHTENLKVVKIIEAGHPVPDENSEKAGREIARLCREGDDRTLFINLISGGGSALLTLPIEAEQGSEHLSLTLPDIQETTELLLSSGTAIQEINCIRKHISGIKGGRLARLMYPATSINLILSDVVGDRLDSIASGLTTGDPTTFKEAASIIKKYDLESRLAANVLAVLQAGLNGRLQDTPKPDDRVFDRVHNILIGTNIAALNAARFRAEELGYRTAALSSQIIGEAREAAKFFLGIGKDIKKHGLLIERPACLIAGGETTVTIRGDGLGGRNQEMALSFLAEIASDPKGSENIYFLSAGTDGNDGPTDAAGAFASLEVLEAGKTADLDVQSYLSRNDSYHYFDKIGRLLKTGPTNTNVGDLQIMIVE